MRLTHRFRGRAPVCWNQAGRETRTHRDVELVRVGESRGDFVSILDGVQAGQEVVSAGAFKLKNNSPIVIDNRVKTTAQLAPRPENH